MTRRPLLVFLLTCVLVLPLLGWLHFVHGVALSDMSVARIRAALAKDSFLRLTLMVNSILYLAAFLKVMFAPPVFERSEEAGRTAAGVSHDGVVFRAPVGGIGRIDPADKKWQILYSDASSGAQIAVSLPGAPPPPERSGPPGNANASAAGVPPIPDSVVSLAESSARKMYRAKVEAFLAENSYASLGPARIDGVDLDFVAIANDDVLVVGVVDPSFGSLAANDSFDVDSAAMWYGASKKYPSPVWAVSTAVKSMKDMMARTLPPDNGVDVRGFVVVPNASVANAGQARSTWNSLGVEVVRFEGYQDELSDFEDVLPSRRGTEPLLQYREFVETMLLYFEEKARRDGARKAA